MIHSFKDKRTEELYSYGKPDGLPPDIISRAIRKLDMLDAAECIEDLKVPRSNRLHKLQGKRKEQHSISINDQWRICFTFKDGNADDVEICDYH